MFCFNPQRLAARCQDVDACRAPEDGGDEGGDSLDDVRAFGGAESQCAQRGGNIHGPAARIVSAVFGPLARAARQTLI
jgi:hypothetical protein